MARILIAEDDPLIGSFLEKGLRASGFSTFLTDDGEQATASRADRGVRPHAPRHGAAQARGLPGSAGAPAPRGTRCRCSSSRAGATATSSCSSRAARTTTCRSRSGSTSFSPGCERASGPRAPSSRTCCRSARVALDLRSRRADDRRSDRRAHRARVLAPRDLHAPPRPGAHARADPLARLGVLLRPADEPRERLRRGTPQEARRRHHRDRPRHRLLHAQPVAERLWVEEPPP